MDQERFYYEMGKKMAKIDTIAESVDKIEKYVLGDNGDGLMVKVKGLATQIKVHWFIFTVIIVALIGWAIK